MGAQQSSAEGQRQGVVGGSSKTCYYELLGVERLATGDEIKKAYRRKALELHPDRNINDVETATRRFAEVQAAYDVLSDPQERAWYDSHRDAILSGQDGSSEGEPTAFRNVRLTTTDEILGLMRKFNAAVPFDDEPTGFFGITRETFEHLALEEEAAADSEGIDCPDYPTFGSSDDSYETVVKSFYSAWAGFSTRKSFSWKDKYRLSDAPDRRVRRLMEKENKKSRDEAAREFNDAVRFLVSFVRKRDPRYLPNTQTDADRQKLLRDAAAAQAARSRAANRAKHASYEVPDWARSRGDDSETNQISGSEEESEIEILECVVCDKAFKSDKQLEAHERSKKHAKALRELRHQMRKEEADLDLDMATPDSGVEKSHEEMTTPLPATERTDESRRDAAPIQASTPLDDGRLREHEDIERGSVHESIVSNDSGEEDDGQDYAPRSIVESRLASNLNREPATESAQVDIVDDLPDSTQKLSLEDTEPKPKIGKARAKRLKKAASRAQEGEVSTLNHNPASCQHRCSVCGAVFISRTKLFNHIREADHATASNIGVGIDRRKKK